MPKNFSRIPAAIRQSLDNITGNDIVVACVKRIAREDVAKYQLHIDGGMLITPQPFVPPASAGKYSAINVHGKEIKRKDQPKVSREFCILAPSWNSSSTHLVCRSREVYPVQFIAPKDLELVITLVEEREGAFIVKFAVDQVLDRQAPDFEDDLLYSLNLLHENIGAVGVFPSDTTAEEYAATIQLTWELLPVGARQDVHELLMRISRGIRSAEEQRIIENRLRIFSRFKPTHFLVGTTGFARYFGAKYGDDFVVFENIRYGNALYVMFDDWQELSRKDRVQLLKSGFDGFERIPHIEGWEERLEAAIKSYRRRQRRAQRRL